MRRTILAGAVALCALPASAETFTLSHYGDWKVDLEEDEINDTLACSAKTENRRGDLFDVTVYADQRLRLWIAFESLNFGKEFKTDVEIHVDYEVWELSNVTFFDSYVDFWFPVTEDSFEFLTELQGGRAVALKRNDDRSRNVAVWSLNGSRKALAAMAGCYERIREKEATGRSMMR